MEIQCKEIKQFRRILGRFLNKFNLWLLIIYVVISFNFDDECLRMLEFKLSSLETWEKVQNSLSFIEYLLKKIQEIIVNNL